MKWNIIKNLDKRCRGKGKSRDAPFGKNIHRRSTTKAITCGFEVGALGDAGWGPPPRLTSRAAPPEATAPWRLRSLRFPAPKSSPPALPTPICVTSCFPRRAFGAYAFYEAALPGVLGVFDATRTPSFALHAKNNLNIDIIHATFFFHFHITYFVLNILFHNKLEDLNYWQSLLYLQTIQIFYYYDSFITAKGE